MPKINAPSVAEHRAQVQARLVDAAEAMLLDGEPLTAGAVSAAAGIARNSIYRYVDSVDDLRSLVLARHLPAWLAAVAEATDGLGARDRVVAWVEANLRQSAQAGHGRLMAAARTAPSAAVDAAVAEAHGAAQAALVSAWEELLPADADRRAMAIALTLGVLDAAFGRLDAGLPDDVVVASTTAAARALTDALAGPATA